MNKVIALCLMLLTSRDILARGDSTAHPLIYINTNFENASQLDWETGADGVVQVSLIYDHERSSPNRANGHWHFQVHAERGSDVTIKLKDCNNIWNGRRGIPISEKTNTLISADGRNWRVIPADLVNETQLKFTLHMDTDKMYVASVEPYRISDLDNLLSEIRNNRLVEITTNTAYSAKLKRFENLLFKHTWFREGASQVKNPGSFGEGMLARFGIDACVYELNYEWAKGLNKEPLGKDWELLGKQLRNVFFEYFSDAR